jgi:hypothetical protein
MLNEGASTGDQQKRMQEIGVWIARCCAACQLFLVVQRNLLQKRIRRIIRE